VYDAIVADYTDFAEKLGIHDLTFIPMSALNGDNVVSKSERLDWYNGATLLHHLESVNVGADRNLVDFRFPVQYVVRPHQDFRGFAGRVASGTVSPGEEVVVLPSGVVTQVRSVEAFEGPLPQAVEGDSVVVTLADEVDVSRGGMIVRRNNLPTVGSRLDAMVCWMGEQPLDPATPYVIQHTTRASRAFVSRVVYRIDVDTLHREEAAQLGLNDIGRVEVTTSVPLFFDAYQGNRATGSFILIDPYSNVTVAAGMIRGPVQTAEELFPAAVEPERAVSPDVVWEGWNVAREEREARNGHGAAVLWFTGLSGAGKTTVAREVERRLFEQGVQTMLLDGDTLRHGLNGDLGFSPADRAENIRRVGEVARLFFAQGAIVLCTFVSPYREDRERVRALIPRGRFLEIFVDAPLDVLKRRDPKGLYARAELGEVANLTGVSAPYEAPENPEMVLRTDQASVEDGVEQIVARLRAEGLLPG
jgi:bifunctional enzyme CysN/CysC